MKKVRLLTGGAALAPVALGLALPATAQAASTAPVTAGHVKGVSLAHTSATPAAPCTGSTEFNIPQLGNVKGHGWQTGNAGQRCIGTVVVSLKFTKGTTANKFCKDAVLSIGGVTGASFGPKSHQVCGVAGEWVHTSYTPHTKFNIPFKVCADSTYGSRTCKTFTG